MDDTIDCVIVGAGVVGLAIGRCVSALGREVLVVEQATTFGSETSSRNSEVIHAGIYYPPESLKARLCIRGNELLYDYCALRDVGHSRTGKLILAARDSDIAALEHYLDVASRTGVRLQRLSAQQVRQIEPAVRCREALLSPTSGIVDTHELMQSLIADIEAQGGTIVYNTAVTGVHRDGCRMIVQARNEDEFSEVACECFINAAGLHAPGLARCIDGIDASSVPDSYYARGRYYALRGASPFQHLVYPVADAASLGVHVTLDLAGSARFGPDVEWIPEIDYAFFDRGREAFAEAIAAYYPAIDVSSLMPAYTGIRPKIRAPGQPSGDFQIDGQEQHGLPGVINLFGIESPGLTSALAIGEYISLSLLR